MHSILLVSSLQERACNKLTSFRRCKDREKTRTDWKRRGSNRDEQEARTLNINIVLRGSQESEHKDSISEF